MIQTFADTFYYLALLNPDDSAHARALAATANRSGLLVTTRWVLTEVGDAMAEPAHRQRFVKLMTAIEDDPNTALVLASEDVFHAGIELFSQRLDKRWSLTDCISFVVMQERGISEALTGDHHFEQAGFVALLAE
jgi:predicted nucleic acid-binding protein